MLVTKKALIHYTMFPPCSLFRNKNTKKRASKIALCTKAFIKRYLINEQMFELKKMFVRAWGSNELASFDTAIDIILLFCHLNRAMMF